MRNAYFRHLERCALIMARIPGGSWKINNFDRAINLAYRLFVR